MTHPLESVSRNSIATCSKVQKRLITIFMESTSNDHTPYLLARCYVVTKVYKVLYT